MATTGKFKYPVIPETIRVHLGRPDDATAPTIEVPFKDYIKTVTSSEIYPTWPENAIRANVLAQISLALNRIYTEWYPSRGYAFDITNSTQFDQAYNPDATIANNVNNIVDELFNNYVRKGENVDPFYTEYCNGTTSTCPGMSQWGTVYLAEQGFTPLQILQYYYGDDLNIVQNAPVEDVQESYAGQPLSFGMRGNDIKLIQAQLNRIRQNFPAIPPIRYVDGVYGVETKDAVERFQEIFQLPVTGIVDKATWYEIKAKYNAVKKLAELASEGVAAEDIDPVVATELSLGSRGDEVRTLQYYLAVISYFIPTIPSIRVDGVFGPATEVAVQDFQKTYSLPITGVVDAGTWAKLQEVYRQIIVDLPPDLVGNQARPYPGYVLNIGMQNSDVRDLQTYLSAVAETDPAIPDVQITGLFDEVTEEAVKAFETEAGLPADGIVGPIVWNRIAAAYNQILREQGQL